MNKKNTLSAFKKLSILPLLAASIGVTSTLEAANENSDNAQNLNAPWSSQPINPNRVDVDLRGIPNSSAWHAGMSMKDMPRKRFRPDYVEPGVPRNPVQSNTDQLMSMQRATVTTENARVVEQQFDGGSFTGVNPPDPTGDVGLNYYIQSYNGSSGSIFSVYNKTTGALVSGPTNMETLGSGQCGSGAGDPIVLFDEMANRWLLSEFSQAGNNLCVYVSQTSDPITGGWYAYAFSSPTFPDYPKYGVGVDAYYVGTNESSPTLYALDRTAMLSGAAASMVRLTAPNLAGFGFQMLQPVDHDGTIAMPAGTPGYFLRHRDDEVHNSSSNNPSEDYIELWQFNADFATTSNSSFTKVADFPVAEFDSSLCGLTSFSCFPQSGSTSTLDPLREVVMFRAQYRNFGSYETIVGNFVTDVNGADHGGIRWFELRRNGASWALNQEGTYSPDSKNRWMGSIAMDKDGNMALAYSWGSSTDFPGLRYTGRLAADANGTMSQPETILVNGTSGISSNRMGDYSHLALDPVDGCTFWYTNEYGKSGGQWGTHISSFKFDTCGGGGGGGNVAPVASFTSSCTDLACSFNGSASSDSDGTIASYSWNFGDGNVASGVNASHTYGASGSYTVSLTVTDNQGATNSTFSVVSVTDPGGGGNVLQNGVPVSGLSGATGDEKFYTLDVPAGATNLSFTTSGNNGDADLYAQFGAAPTTSNWECRGYTGGSNEVCNITNVQTGTYHVMVRAYSAYSGLSLTGSYTIITNSAPTASFTNSCTDLNCSFNGSASSDSDGTISSYAWDFGDGSNGTGVNASHNFASAGTYTVMLTVTDNSGATNATSTNVSVTAPPVNVAPTASFTSSCTDLSCSFNGSASSDSDGTISSYAWDFGDGSSGSGVNASNVYTAAGTYTVTLTVTDDDGATNATSSNVSVTAPTGGNELVNGVAVTGLSGASASEVFYTLVVPAGASNLSFAISNGTGDADLYVRFGAAPTTATHDCRPYLNGNSETCNISTAQVGTYHVMIRAFNAYSGLSLVASYTTGGGGGSNFFENLTNVNIPDNNSAGITSNISVIRSGQAGTISVAVDIKHTYIGDLTVDVISPSGTSTRVHNRAGGSANDILQTYTVNAGTEPSNGTWQLKVIDSAGADTGYIDAWSITFQ